MGKEIFTSSYHTKPNTYAAQQPVQQAGKQQVTKPVSPQVRPTQQQSQQSAYSMFGSPQMKPIQTISPMMQPLKNNAPTVPVLSYPNYYSYESMQPIYYWPVTTTTAQPTPSVVSQSVPLQPVQQSQAVQKPQPAAQQPLQAVQTNEVPNVASSVLYFYNSVPYISYSCYPDVLFPYYLVDQTTPQSDDVKQRVVGEIATAIGDIIEETVHQHVNSLENYVNTMEQNAVNTVKTEIKSSCLGFCKK